MSYDYSYNVQGVESLEGMESILGIMGAIMIFVYIIAMAVAVFFAVCNWKIFAKAGIPGWQSIIPYFSTYKQFQIAYGDGWLCLLLLIPIVNIFVSLHYTYKLSVAFGRGIGFTLGLLFVPIVFYPILAFSKDIQYMGPQM